MCGFCGVLQKSSGSVSGELIRHMARTMRHRGPDEEGYWESPSLALGFQRLAIIDQAGGHQPMTNEDATLRVVFNGEIYNHQALRRELEQTGRHRFKSRCDTEVLLHLYEEEGVEFVNRLEGMFAFALWDSVRQRLLLARDRLGKKPLVYADLPDAFLFASETKALLVHPALPKEIDRESINLFLSYQYIPSPRTIYTHVQKLLPAHVLVCEKGRVTLKRYWTPSLEPKTRLSLEEALPVLKETLREAVRARMVADVPVGAFLSGGKDSSLIVALMSELSAQPVQTFSMGFPEDQFSELPFAREVAERFGCDHHEFMMPDEGIDLLPKLVWHYGEPFADASALPSFYLSQETRRHVKVALCGDGGDELFAGYPRYQAMKAWQSLQRIPQHLRQGLMRALHFIPEGTAPFSIAWKLRRLSRVLASNKSEAYFQTLGILESQEKSNLYTPAFRQRLSGLSAAGYVNAKIAEAESASSIDPYLYADLLSYLPECLLVKMDIASMAHSLEVRSPFLDAKVVELVERFPPEWKLRGIAKPKYLLDRLIAGWLPSRVAKRPKQGFSLPISLWMRGPLKAQVEERLLSPQALGRGIFEEAALRRLLAEHASGRRDHSYGLWALLILETWFQVYAHDARF
jgi:asparagine synthase (glutamine-hydrolysing)